MVKSLTKDITPLEGGIGFAVKLTKESDFVGKAALVKQKEEGLKRRIVAIELTGRVFLVTVTKSSQRTMRKSVK